MTANIIDGVNKKRAAPANTFFASGANVMITQEIFTKATDQVKRLRNPPDFLKTW
ncbi:hypothetical protein [Thalassotalea piscium]|uniref:Uncharacterized protein n=1 Tax=Thalassotalea piscium TaxID=1230533 RepID=A0A7X0NI45_9GAMM|nr:hypothetical protein [Thalassotalea piscium]MBB6543892.1 hypothetical protein [Thalassotalea piscium]